MNGIKPLRFPPHYQLRTVSDDGDRLELWQSPLARIGQGDFERTIDEPQPVKREPIPWRLIWACLLLLATLGSITMWALSQRAH